MSEIVKKPLAVGIAGSPRPGGNSTALLKAYLDGTSKAGFETKIITLNKLLYRGCQGCDQCVRGLECSVKDELNGIFPILREARIWAMASPIYYNGISGQLKMFYDRLHFIIHDPHKLPGPRRGIVMVTYEVEERQHYTDVAENLARCFNWQDRGDFGNVEVVAEPNLGPVDAWKKQPELLERIKNTGHRQAGELMDILNENHSRTDEVQEKK